MNLIASSAFALLLAVSVASADEADRKSTRLNSSHSQISYAVFCLKKKRYLTYMLPILGIDRTEEVTKFCAQHKAPETTKGVEAGIEKLRINQAFLKRVRSSEEQMIEVQGLH